MFNKCIFEGRLGGDLEQKTAAGSGNVFATGNLAVNESRKTDEGWETETVWVSLTFFGKQAENAMKVLKKGDLISVDAKYSKKQYQTKSGEKAYSHNFIVNQWNRLVSGGATTASEEDEDYEDTPLEDLPF